MGHYIGTQEEICQQKKFFIFRADAKAWIDEESFLRKGISAEREPYKCRWCVGFHVRKKETYEQRMARRIKRLGLFALETNFGQDQQTIMDEIELGF